MSDPQTTGPDRLQWLERGVILMLFGVAATLIWLVARGVCP